MIIESNDEKVIEGKVIENTPSQSTQDFMNLQVEKLAGKIDKGEVHKIFEIALKERTEREKIPEHYRLLDNKSDRYYRLAIFFTVVVFLIFAMIFLIQYGKDEMLKTLLVSLLSFLGGLGLGKSSILGSKKDEKEKN